jgi:hypothetical protein
MALLSAAHKPAAAGADASSLLLPSLLGSDGK